MKDFGDLRVWEKAHVLALDSYRATNNFPKTEMFGLQAKFAERLHRLQRTLQRDVGNAAMENSSGF